MLKKIQAFDEKIFAYIDEKMSNKYMDLLMKSLTYLGDYALIWIALFFLLYSKESYRQHSLFLVTSLLATSIITEVILKNIVKRLRPNKKLNIGSTLVKTPNSYSFPSGHTATSFSAIMSAAMASTPLGIIVLITACLIGISRIYLKVHYFTDVFIGAIIGSIVPVILILI